MLETKTIGDLTAAGAVDGTELIEVEQSGASKKISADVPRLDDLDEVVALDTASDQLRISQGADDHRRMVLDDFLTALGITAYSEAVDMSGGDYAQTSTAKRQFYTITTGAASNAFNLLPRAQLEGCRIRITKVDTGAGVGTVTPNGAETFLRGATAFALRKQGDFIEYEVQGANMIVIDSLSTVDSAQLAATTPQNLALGIGVIPRTRLPALVCTSSDQGFAAGEEIAVYGQTWWNTANYLQVSIDTTNYNIFPGTTIPIRHKTTQASTSITYGKWILRLRYSL